MNKVENIDGIKPILNKLKENRKGLYISRIPDDVKKRFTELAEKEFCNDFGMVLKFLMDGIIQPETQLIIEQIQDIETRLVSIESNMGNISMSSDNEEKKITTCSGKNINKNE